MERRLLRRAVWREVYGLGCEVSVIHVAKVSTYDSEVCLEEVVLLKRRLDMIMIAWSGMALM